MWYKFNTQEGFGSNHFMQKNFKTGGSLRILSRFSIYLLRKYRKVDHYFDPLVLQTKRSITIALSARSLYSVRIYFWEKFFYKTPLVLGNSNL